MKNFLIKLFRINYSTILSIFIFLSMSFNLEAKDKCHKNLSIKELQDIAFIHDESQNYKDALTCIKILVKKNDDMGQTFFGYYYFFGLGVKLDYSKAYKFFKLAADQNNAYSMNYLSYLHEYSLGGASWDLNKAFNYAKKSIRLTNLQKIKLKKTNFSDFPFQ